MRNLENAIKRVGSFKGPLSKSIVCATAKQTLNQYARGWLKPDLHLQPMINFYGIRDLLEKPLQGRRLDKALTAQGREFLNRFLFTSKGVPRKTRDTKYLPDSVFSIVKAFSHFEFVCFTDDNYNNYTPVWRVFDRKGNSFSYSYNGGRFNPNGAFEIHGS
jgi:hypothetical protein